MGLSCTVCPFVGVSGQVTQVTLKQHVQGYPTATDYGPFDSQPVVYYWRSIVIMALSGTVWLCWTSFRPMTLQLTFNVI